MATTVEPINATTAADLSGVAFTGRVASVRSYWTQNPREIESEIVFQELEYLKGDPPVPGDTFRLTVPGGTVGSITFRIAGAPEFTAGERWLLFLLPEYSTHPVIGISQWAFRVEDDPAGVARVYTAGRQSVAGLDAGGFPRAASATSSGGRLAGSHQVHVIGTGGAGTPIAMSHRELVEALRPILDRSVRTTGSDSVRPRRIRHTSVPLPSASALSPAGSEHGSARTNPQTRAKSPRQVFPDPCRSQETAREGDRP